MHLHIGKYRRIKGQDIDSSDRRFYPTSLVFSLILIMPQILSLIAHILIILQILSEIIPNPYSTPAPTTHNPESELSYGQTKFGVQNLNAFDH